MLNLLFWKKGSKGQGALEYLLIIGAAILIAAIVVTILVKTTKTTEGSVDKVYGDFNKVVSDINLDTDINTGEVNTPVGCDADCISEKFKGCIPAEHTDQTGDGYDITIYGLEPVTDDPPYEEDELWCKINVYKESELDTNCIIPEYWLYNELTTAIIEHCDLG